jgi:hypothetical protein
MKEVEHTDAYTMGGAKTPASDTENEYWIKDKKIVFKSGRDKTFIFDLTKKQFLFINDKEKTYVEISAPPDRSRIFSDQLTAKYDMYKETGTVTKTHRTQKLQGKTCTGYEVKTWKDSGGIRFSELSAMVWATADVSFDLNVYYGMLRCIRVLYNRDEVFLKNLDKIKGCQMGMDMIMVRQDTKIKITHRIVEMIQKKAPGDFFSVPGDYTKKEKLSFGDLWK